MGVSWETLPLFNLLHMFFPYGKLKLLSLWSEDLKEALDMYVELLQQQNTDIHIVRVRHEQQRGLAYARASGWRAAAAEVVAILDAHIEVQEMW